MPFKNIDNPWLVRTLLSMLTLFGVIVGTAFAPIMVMLFSPLVQSQAVDAYAQLTETPWYRNGAVIGGVFGFLLALGILVQLSRQAELEKRQIAAGEHAPAAH